MTDELRWVLLLLTAEMVVIPIMVYCSAKMWTLGCLQARKRFDQEQEHENE